MTMDRTTVAMIGASTCPSWCAYPAPCDLHMSETISIAAGTADGEPVQATLVADYDGDSRICVSVTAERFLPVLSIDGAEQLAAHILDLVAAARKG